MSMRFMRFKDGKEKALTLSYDDGVYQDKRLVEIMDKNGLKGTFNLSSIMIDKQGSKSRAMGECEIIETYKNHGYEIALHGHTHPYLEELSSENCVYEIMKDREVIEKITGDIIKGCAYPFGTYNDRVIDILKMCGIKYARTVVSTEKFDVPTDWLRMPTTCHHKNPRLFELTKTFIEKKKLRKPWLFYLWGHSYEFDDDNNWDIIEKFAQTVGNRDDIWYATNVEIYDYVQAYRSLETSVDGSIVYNPTQIDVWMYDDTINDYENGEVYCIRAGEKVKIF